MVRRDSRWARTAGTDNSSAPPIRAAARFDCISSAASNVESRCSKISSRLKSPFKINKLDKKEGRAVAWTDKLWVYDLRTNQHFTLKQKSIQRSDFDEFVGSAASTRSTRPGTRMRCAMTHFADLGQGKKLLRTSARTGPSDGACRKSTSRMPFPSTQSIPTGV